MKENIYNKILSTMKNYIMFEIKAKQIALNNIHPSVIHAAPQFLSEISALHQISPTDEELTSCLHETIQTFSSTLRPRAPQLFASLSLTLAHSWSVMSDWPKRISQRFKAYA